VGPVTERIARDYHLLTRRREGPAQWYHEVSGAVGASSAGT